MAMDDFHAKWFGRSATITPPTWEERQQRKMDYLRNLASSPLAEELVERFELPEIREAEDAFKQALAGISDPEARDRLDTAAGRISAAYQLLGFCVGHTSQSSEAFF